MKLEKKTVSVFDRTLYHQHKQLFEQAWRVGICVLRSVEECLQEGLWPAVAQTNVKQSELFEKEPVRTSDHRVTKKCDTPR